MQKAISMHHNGKTLRGMEHIPGKKGKYPAVILFHGFTGSKLEPHRFFLKISRALEELGIASFRFDFSGSGESDGDFKEMTVLGELDEARAILKFVQSHPNIDTTNITILGFSMGGLVASLLAGEAQKTIEKLILLAPAGTMKDTTQSWVNQFPFIEHIQAHDVEGNLVGTAFFEELEDIEVWEQAAQYNNDVLLIHGSKDEAVPSEVSSMYIDRCYQDNATLHIVEGAGHTFNGFEWEQEVIEAIKRFVS